MTWFIMPLNFAISNSVVHSALHFSLFCYCFFSPFNFQFVLLISRVFRTTRIISFLLKRNTLQTQHIGQMPLCAWAEISPQWSNDHYLGNLILEKLSWIFFSPSQNESRWCFIHRFWIFNYCFYFLLCFSPLTCLLNSMYLSLYYWNRRIDVVLFISWLSGFFTK